MLDPDLITREDLYEAIWSEAVQKVAEALGISDVGLAKICKKLNVPRPGRGYWAKSPRLRKVLRKPLPPLKEGQESSTSISGPAMGGGAGWTREALKTLANEGIPLPTVAAPSLKPGTHPLIAAYRDLVTQKGWGVRSLVKEKACLALAVSEPALARGFAILQTIFVALEAQGIMSEVIPPQRARNSYGYTYEAPEAGHALLAYHLFGAERLEHLSLLPGGDGGLAGAYLRLPEGPELMDRAWVSRKLAVDLAGRAAERLVFGDGAISAGVAQDLASATSLATMAVGEWGLDPQFPTLSTQGLSAPLQAQLGTRLLTQVAEWVGEAEAEALRLLNTHRSELDLLAGALLRKETLHQPEILALLQGTSPAA